MKLLVMKKLARFLPLLAALLIAFLIWKLLFGMELIPSHSIHHIRANEKDSFFTDVYETPDMNDSMPYYIYKKKIDSINLLCG